MDEPQEILISTELPNSIQKAFKSYRDSKQLCDFTIHVGETEFQVHKLLLAACSEFFEDMFRHDFLESKQNKATIHDVSVTSFEAILEFCYTSQINIGPDNVEDILRVSSMMGINHLQSICVEYIKNRVNISNCLGVLAVADRFNFRELYENALFICLDKFESIIDEQEFLELDEKWMHKIISHNQLNVKSEELVYDAVMRWFEVDKEERIQHLDNLLSCVRFSLLEPLKLIALSSDNFIKGLQECHNLITIAKDSLLLQAYTNEKSKVDEHRTPLRKQQRIYAIGGWTNEFRPIAQVEKYNPYTDKWKEVKPMTSARCGVGVTIYGNSIYAIGGYDGQRYLKSVERYDLDKRAWFTDVEDMESERTSVGVVSLDGYIYAIGGQLGSSSTAAVERYNVKSGSWEECATLNEQRLGAGVCVLNGYIYAAGGADDKALATVERYDPAINKWVFVASMKTSRKHLGCAAYNGKIYAVGGRADSTELETAECYDPESDTWTSLPSMSEKRSGIGLVELDGLLYAVGGHNGDMRLKLVEAYDPIEEKWTTRQEMRLERLGGGLVVHSRLKNITDQTPKRIYSSAIENSDIHGENCAASLISQYNCNLVSDQ